MSVDIVERLRAYHGRTGAYAPDATCKHGVHPYDCRNGCAPVTFEAADEIEKLRAAAKECADIISGLGEWEGKTTDWIRAADRVYALLPRPSKGGKE